AYACGLGTFSLSRGLITKKGVAGRFGSVITSLAIPATGRPYSGLYDYCTNCGACLRNCPVRAISRENGKDHVPCSRFLNKTRAENAPYYGCGKCQTATPCETGIPASSPR
ncbi:MAG: 4Fe-4S binding protein, partial [Spirochaetales bacterium]|nr:4Fe-4S binding protein [Spirochaetales bacterium]